MKRLAMRKVCKLLTYVISVGAILGACSIGSSQIATPQSTEVASTPSTPTTNTSQQMRIGNPLLATTTIPVTWSNLNLTGKLVYISAQEGGSGNPILSIQSLDLVTGGITTIFQGPEISWVYYATVSPDQKQLIMSYSSPPENQNPVNELLYTLPVDGSTTPQFFVLPPTIFDRYIQAEWSPDGKYIYYVHSNYQNQPLEQHYPIYEILRVAYPNGQPEKVADQAFWPGYRRTDRIWSIFRWTPIPGKTKYSLPTPMEAAHRK